MASFQALNPTLVQNDMDQPGDDTSINASFIWSLTLAFAISLPVLAVGAYQRHRRRAAKFPFLQLPIEIREMIYGHLMERPPTYPPLPVRPRPIFSVNRITRRGRPSNGNRIMLANRQIYDEFMRFICKNATFTLTLNESNMHYSKLWSMTQETMKQMRKCNLRIVAPSSMLGQFHADMENEIVRLRNIVERNMGRMTRLDWLTLHVRASNPLWLWFYGSQEFKTAQSLPFKEISLSSDCWTRGENHLSKNSSGQWEWRCPFDHFVADGWQEKQQIREFCASLYAQCAECDEDKLNQ